MFDSRDLGVEDILMPISQDQRIVETFHHAVIQIGYDNGCASNVVRGVSGHSIGHDSPPYSAVAIDLHDTFHPHHHGSTLAGKITASSSSISSLNRVAIHVRWTPNMPRISRVCCRISRWQSSGNGGWP